MIKVRILALLSVLALLLTLPAIASAQSVPPHIFIGSATVNGMSAPSGTVITAMIGGDAKGSAKVGSNGEYGPLHVASGSGSEISFVLDTLTASETATWEQGGASVLALNASVGGGGEGGAAGSAGSAGKAGANGKDGADGSNGKDGANGANGANGTNGKAGADGSNGKDGADGKNGAAGPAGPAGGGAVAIFALILAIVALIGVGAVYFLGKQNA
jgi:hypothetical protein